MKFWIGIVLAIGSALFYQNCAPFVSSSDSNRSLPSTTAFSLSCASDDPRNPAGSELKKLNKFELENTLLDLFEPYMNSAELTNFSNAIRPFLDAIPDSREEIGMDLANQGVTVIHVERHFLLAEAAADFVTANSGILERMLGNCSGNPRTAACQRSFLQSFGQRVLRRPLGEEDFNHHLQTMSGHSDSYRNVVAALLASPNFYYHSEFGESDAVDSSEGVVVSLGPYERASKISYFLLQSMPDGELFAAAERGELTTSQGVSQQVNRLLQDSKTRQRLTRYFANQWMHLDETNDLSLDIQEVQARLSELGTPPPIDNLRSDMIDEVYDYFDYLIWEQQASFRELMTSNLVFPRSPAMSMIYGTNQWDGSYNLDSLVRAPESERAGVLTRAQFLFTGTGSTRPIMRGVHVYRDFMCQNLDLPPDNSTPEGVALNDEMTDQEIVKATTEVEGTSCVGCHQRIINPLGFAFDNFDSFGRFRNQERVFHPETDNQAGQVLMFKDVNSTGEININPFVTGMVNGAVELTRQLATSPDAQACFSSKLWNFAQKKNMRVETNPCAVQSIYQEVGASDGSIIDAIRSLVQQPEFLKRNVQ